MTWIDSILQLWELFPDALITGIVMAVATSIVGVFVILKRVVFISVALSETATLGIALAMIYHLSPFWGATFLTLLMVLFLAINNEDSLLPRETLLGVIFLLGSSLSILLLSQSGFGLNEIKSMLYGDLILASSEERNVLLWVALPSAFFMLIFHRPIVYVFLDKEASKVLGINTKFWEIAFFFVLSLLVSASSKTGGSLLVFSNLVVIPAIALLLSRNINMVLFLAPLIGSVLTLSGMVFSYEKDLPSNQTIIVFSTILFLIIFFSRGLKKRMFYRKKNN